MISNVVSSACRSISASIIVTTGSVRDDIESVRSCWFWLLLACTIVVAIGVIIEEATEHLSANDDKWIVEPAWHNILARMGWTLVILGVIGEGLFEAAASSADSLLQEFNSTLLAIATEQAGNAAKSAERAKAAVDAAEIEVHRLRFLVVPRQQLLMKSDCNFVDAVRSFAPQGIEIKTNLAKVSDQKDRIETGSFVLTIKFLLGHVSKWQISDGQGENGPGIMLSVRRDAPPRTTEAGKALASALGDCNVTDINGERPTLRVAQAGSLIDRENGPPDRIVLFVGTHPQ